MSDAFPSDPFEAQCRLMSGLAKSDITIFDVGANKGQTAANYRRRFPAAEIYCFEPFPESVATLQAAFSNDEHTHVVPKAVAEKSGTATFYVTKFDATHSLLPRFTSGRRYYPEWAGPKETIDIEAIALDDFIGDKRISTVDILKMDVQSGELLVLRGAQSLLRTAGVSLIYTEIMFVPHYEGSPLFHEMTSYLSGFGFSLFQIYNLHTAPNGQLRFGEAIFVSDRVRSDVIDAYPEET
ncbi:MAG: FkbM family methyltransferase [Planctomycetaceae bacterium]